MQREKKNLLVFGYGMAVILAFIAFRNYRHHGWQTLNTVLTVASAAFVLITLFSEPLLKKIYTAWMKVAHVIGGVVTTILLSILFYLIFGTIGLISRILGKDILDQKIDRARMSYWVRRENKPFNKESYTKQF